ncbi:hypothetical protein ACFYZH_31315 [Streptomyces abikoensis]|uniref:hypothetical protein n=1 Tax=Streptomyces abikoensis TaxID=97398 RepID=UPI0036CB1AEC
MFRFHGGSRPLSRAAIGTALVLATTAVTVAVPATAAQAAPAAAVASTASGPAVPKDFEARYANGVVLTWTANKDEATTGYRIYRWRTADGPDTAQVIATAGKVPFAGRHVDETELDKGGVHYSYAITAVGKDGAESGFSTPRDIVRPWHAAPVDVAATLADGTLNIHWKQPEAGDRPDHWMIYRSKTAPVRPETGAELFYEAGGSDVTLQVPEKEGNDYYYAVVAISPARSAYSKSVKPTLAERKPGQPAAPVMWNVGSAGNQGEIALVSWDDGKAKPGDPRIVGYNVYRWTSEERPDATDRSGATKLNAAPVGDRTFQDPGVRDGVKYWYAVTAVTADGTESAPAAPVLYWTA